MAKATLSAQDVDRIKALHKENMEKLSEVIGGQADISKPKPITHPQASCLISHCIGNQVAILNVIDKAERK